MEEALERAPAVRGRVGRVLREVRRDYARCPKGSVGGRPSTGDAQPEHATGDWGVVIHPLTTLVSRAGQVCVPFKI